MSSIHTSMKQIPAEAAYFRPVPTLALNAGAFSSNILAFTAGSGAPLRTSNSSTIGANGSFVPATWNAASSAAYPLLSSGQCLLKDMGRTIVSAGRTFRRVQMVMPAAAFSATGGIDGTASGVDADYMCGYIELGLRGNGSPAPFVRA
jgi:hypothetical protein